MVNRTFVRTMLILGLSYPMLACTGSTGTIGDSGTAGSIDGSENDPDYQFNNGGAGGTYVDEDVNQYSNNGTGGSNNGYADNGGSNNQGTGGSGDGTVTLSPNENGTDPLAEISASVALPILYVHDRAGSSQQFESQAIRFVANGYPGGRIIDFQHDGSDNVDTSSIIGTMEELIDNVLSGQSVEQIYLIGHGRGTELATNYLTNPANANKIAKYVSLDGVGCANLNIPCIGLAAADNDDWGQTQTMEGQTHVEVATSPESFVAMFNFLVGYDPKVVNIVTQRAAIQIAGLVVDYPSNAPVTGGILDIWEVDSSTGQRTGSAPVGSFMLSDEGAFGPVAVEPTKHYEHFLYFEDGSSGHHFYSQPYLRSTGFIRLQTGETTEEQAQYANPGDDHSILTLIRQREWTTDDIIEMSMSSDQLGTAKIDNVISTDIGIDNVALTIQDDTSTPGESTMELLSWFDSDPQQAGIDVFVAGATEPDGVISITNYPRGDTSRPQTVNVPNWASSTHAISVLFSDYAR